ncbi:cobalamin-independent methionine synthase II family protein [Salinicola rhizosphaerae]|uniref:5-methyltetrahydropteroyltriglutamate--homocysteine S-methyltransferase n=1 Tax=Salinicola rhizosphaerae TaxID=1443141 RepID=A0ABQ3EBB7_9GAMM|nr:cobalamin-independent methionine synthase II family protein [Salinicola rhizosphaerae]GHB32141.1 5-methyltetrahydropteroyltriglutamate--homocysteine S-methyltransferase [Salinicola rhizosphaerae]
MSQTHPPFRADIVGSFLRPAALKEARAQFQRDDIDATALKAVEDAEIRRVVEQQEALGMKVATDGEFRRSWWHFDFLEHLEGVTGYFGDQGIQFQGKETSAKQIRVDGKVAFNPTHPMLDHFRYLASVTRVMPKMTIPSPSVLHFRGGRRKIDSGIYPSLDAFFADTADAYRDAVRAFYDAGCRYLQLDDTVWAYLCSEKELQAARDRGDDPDRLQSIYAEMLNHALADKPDDLYVGLHVCRGNFRSTWISEGGYEPVAETLFGKVGVDAWFLEYDSERAGSLDPLRFIPEGAQQAVLGLITTKVGELENPDAVRARLDEATQYVDKSQICLSPQCGFASTEEGNDLAEQAQWDKVRLVHDIAKAYWPDA